MASLYTHQDSNVRKTWLLMTMFLVVVVAIGWFVSFYFDDPSFLFFAVIFSVLMNIFSYYNSDKIVLKLYKAKEVTRESHRELWNSVENLSITAGLPMPKLYVINDPAPNAFATGRDKEHAAIAVTSGLLDIMDRNELDGVIAHELSHIGNRDILLMTVVVILVGFITLIADMFLRGSMWGGRGDNKNGGGVMMVIGVIFIVLSPIIAKIIQLAVSRKREYLADASGALLTRYPEGLASALEKLGSYKGEVRRVNNATAHLFISDPHGGKRRMFSKMFMTHPPIEDRIKKLREEA